MLLDLRLYYKAFPATIWHRLPNLAARPALIDPLFQDHEGVFRPENAGTKMWI